MKKIVIKTHPVSVNKLYQGRRFLTSLGKSTKEAMAWEAKTQWKENILVDNVELEIDFYFKDKRGMDIDGALKGLLDCLTGVIWKDDKQITYLAVTKEIDKENPRIEIEII